MRIGIDIRHLCAPNPSGVDYYSRELITRLIQSTEAEFTLFASGSARSLAELPSEFRTERPHVTTHLLRMPNRMLNAKLLAGAITLDDLVASSIDAWFFPNLNFIRTQKPYVITAHDLSFAFLPECYSPKTRIWHKLVQPERLYTQARRIIAVSESTATDLQTVYQIPQKKIATIPLAANDSFAPRMQPSDAQILRTYGIKGDYFLMLSTIEPRKNHLGAIAAYERWRTNGGNKIPLIIAGKKGYESARVLHAIRKSPYGTDIHILGYIAHEHRPALIRQARILLFPSLYEGFALPVREAIQSGVPVLTSNTSAMLEHTSSTTLHVSPWHLQEMSDGIAQLLLLPRDKKRVVIHESWDSVAKRTQEVFNTFLS